MASMKFNNVYINDSFTVAGHMEKDGQLTGFNLTMNDFYYNENTFEDAEVKMQKVVIDNLLLKNKLIEQDISFLISGDLSNQITISNEAAKHYNIPFFGIYSACATFVEGLIIASKFLDDKNDNKALTVTSSHNLNAEKQFRFPVEYGALRPETTTFTATGCVGTYLSKKSEKALAKIEGATIGRVIDLGTTDAGHMGAVMAPAAAATVVKHLQEFNRNADYYDLILTGDLGEVGSKIFLEYMKRNYNIILKNHEDAGTQVYVKSQETYSGASGPVSLPIVLFNKTIKNKKNKKILLIATGSLHNTTLVNQKKDIPAIAHAVSLEVLK